MVAQGQYYGAPIAESIWAIEASDTECVLIHEIPGYGRALFWQTPGRQLQFALQFVESMAPKNKQVTVISMSPSWKHGIENRSLENMAIDKSNLSIHWEHSPVRRIYHELEQGMFMEFRYKDGTAEKEEIRIRVSPGRFHEVLPKFQTCMEGLGSRSISDGKPPPLTWNPGEPYGFDILSEVSIYCATASHELSQAGRLMLSRIASFLKSKEGELISVTIAGYSDQRGRKSYNDKLSHQRANAVKDFLVPLGVSANKINTRHYGERHLFDSNENEVAWARNRRAVITLTP
jgi:outer membrane protein OmpA-like peptidoglycan-associated protein